MISNLLYSRRDNVLLGARGRSPDGDHPRSSIVRVVSPRRQRARLSVTESARTCKWVYPIASAPPSVRSHLFPVRGTEDPTLQRKLDGRFSCEERGVAERRAEERGTSVRIDTHARAVARERRTPGVEQSPRQASDARSASSYIGRATIIY